MQGEVEAVWAENSECISPSSPGYYPENPYGADVFLL